MIVDCAVYQEGRRRDGHVDLAHAYKACRDQGCFAWIGLYEPTEEEFTSLSREFDLHPLAVEDAIHAHQRPKLEMFGEMALLVLKTARYVDSNEVVTLGEILVFVGHDFVITVRHGEASDLHEVRERLESSPELLRSGPGAVVHAIVDRVVDDYQPAIDGLEEDVEEVETEVFSPGRPDRSERIYRLKRETLDFYHAAAPLLEPVNRLARGHYEIIPHEVRAYFRDVNDHLLRVHEQLEGLRDVLTSVLQANLAQVTVRQNEDLRKISAAVAILAVPTAIAGIYGMNFEHMPELTWTFGYPLVLAAMAVICVLIYRYFRHVGWL
ncbi:MAG TPA: magnesium/cobalt transporter CorA [Thermoleophilaceae bacterium]|nr:magnesium/cobalt transporter CorA [Thermoleophilaceae bacterium]